MRPEELRVDNIDMMGQLMKPCPLQECAAAKKSTKSRYRCHRLGIWITGVPRKEWSGEMKQHLSATAQRQCDAGEMI